MKLLQLFEVMDENEARLARAKAMGFDTSTVWYHGTPEPEIHSFQGYRGVAGHFTTDPGWAQQFGDAELGNILDNLHPDEMATDPAALSLYPVFLRLKNVFDLRNPEHRASIGMDPDAQVFIDYSTLEDNVETIKAAGYDGYIDYESPEDDDGSVAVFDPANIRSVYAKFEDSNSSNITASIGEAAGKRGPHEGHELELMLQGTKPLAMLERRNESPEKQAIWDKLIEDGRVIHKAGQTITTTQNHNRHQTDFLALPGEEWRIASAQRIYDEVQRTDRMTDEHHIGLGNLLGYAPKDIELFVGRPINEGQPVRPPTVAYHATFPENRDSIRLHGLDPKYDTTFEDGGAVYFATGGIPDPKMDIWKADLSGLPLEYDNVQVAGEPGWGDNEHWWYTTVNVVPDRLKLVQKGKSGIIGESIQGVYHTMQIVTEIEKLDSFFSDMREAWVGGIADFGDPQAAINMRQHPQYDVYHDALSRAVTDNLGDPFVAYRLMSEDQIEEWQSGADMPAIAVSTELSIAKAFRNLAANRGRDDLQVVALSVPADAVIMLGHSGEHELVVDANWISAHEVKFLNESMVMSEG